MVNSLFLSLHSTGSFIILIDILLFENEKKY